MTKESETKTAAREPELGTWRIMKNVVIISFAFMLHFTAYSGVVNLQSSINAEAGLGMASLAAVYVGLIFSNIFLPPIVIKWVGTKWTISLSFVTYMPYVAAQLWPTVYTLIPTALILGLGGGPLWTSQCTYFAVVSDAHSKLSIIPAEAILSRFLGLFFMIFLMNQVWGNLISSLVISTGDNVAAVTAVNESLIPQLCGASFLPSVDAEKALQEQPPEKIQMIAGIYLACMACAALAVAIGVDSIKRYSTDRSGSGAGHSALALLTATTKFFTEPYQLMLTILLIFNGYQQAFFTSDFTVAFVSCAIGPGTVGFIMTSYGVSAAVGCLVTGYLAKVTGRMPLVGTATVVHTCLVIALLVWRPQAHHGYLMYVVAVLWGLCDSVWMVQINAYYGHLFKGREEAAFSNSTLWMSVGCIIAYTTSPYARTSVKLYFTLMSMFVGVALYFMVEFREYKINKKNEIQTTETRSIPEGFVNIAFQTIE